MFASWFDLSVNSLAAIYWEQSSRDEMFGTRCRICFGVCYASYKISGLSFALERLLNCLVWRESVSLLATLLRGSDACEDEGRQDSMQGFPWGCFGACSADAQHHSKLEELMLCSWLWHRFELSFLINLVSDIILGEPDTFSCSLLDWLMELWFA